VLHQKLILSLQIYFILLKTGELLFPNFVDKGAIGNTEYRTADFIPPSTLAIAEFEFIENEKLNMKFS
jgi:hypothetical protein